MGILRKIRKDNFTTVSNDYLQDCVLSWKAKGMITYLMSLPDDWKVNIMDLTNRSKDGRDSVMSTMKEIEVNGYGRKIKTRSSKGMFDNFDFEVGDSRVFDPVSGNPIVGKPILENPTLVNTNNKKDLDNKKSPPSKQITIFPESNNDKLSLFRNCIYGDKKGELQFLRIFDKPDYLGIDINYYYHSVKDWSDSANKKRTAKGWIATARGFMRSDKDNNKLKMLIVESQESDDDAIKYLTGDYE